MVNVTLTQADAEAVVQELCRVTDDDTYSLHILPSSRNKDTLYSLDHGPREALRHGYPMKLDIFIIHVSTLVAGVSLGRAAERKHLLPIMRDAQGDACGGCGDCDLCKEIDRG